MVYESSMKLNSAPKLRQHRFFISAIAQTEAWKSQKKAMNIISAFCKPLADCVGV